MSLPDVNGKSTRMVISWIVGGLAALALGGGTYYVRDVASDHEKFAKWLVRIECKIDNLDARTHDPRARLMDCYLPILEPR